MGNVSNRKNRKVKCKLCKLGGKVTLISYRNFSKHIRNIHEKEKKIRVRVRCPICDKEMNKRSLHTHVKNIHGSGKDKANGDKHKQLVKPPPSSSNSEHQEKVDEEVMTFD